MECINCQLNPRKGPIHQNKFFCDTCFDDFHTIKKPSPPQKKSSSEKEDRIEDVKKMHKSHSGLIGPKAESAMYAVVLHRALSNAAANIWTKRIPKMFSSVFGAKGAKLNKDLVTVLQLPMQCRPDDWAVLLPLSSAEAKKIYAVNDLPPNSTEYAFLKQIVSISKEVVDLRCWNKKRADFPQSWVTLFDRTS